MKDPLNEGTSTFPFILDFFFKYNKSYIKENTSFFHLFLPTMYNVCLLQRQEFVESLQFFLFLLNKAASCMQSKNK